MTPTPADNALSALDEIEKAFWYAEKGDAFSGYGISLIKSSINTLRTYITSTAGQGGDEYQRGYKAGKDHYCKIANHNLDGFKPEDAPQSIFLDGCGNGTYKATPDDRHTIEYVNKATIDFIDALQPHPPQPDKCEGLIDAMQRIKKIALDNNSTAENRVLRTHYTAEQAIAKYKETT